MNDIQSNNTKHERYNDFIIEREIRCLELYKTSHPKSKMFFTTLHLPVKPDFKYWNLAATINYLSRDAKVYFKCFHEFNKLLSIKIQGFQYRRCREKGIGIRHLVYLEGSNLDAIPHLHVVTIAPSEFADLANAYFTNLPNLQTDWQDACSKVMNVRRKIDVHSRELKPTLEYDYQDIRLTLSYAGKMFSKASREGLEKASHLRQDVGQFGKMFSPVQNSADARGPKPPTVAPTEGWNVTQGSSHQRNRRAKILSRMVEKIDPKEVATLAALFDGSPSDQGFKGQPADKFINERGIVDALQDQGVDAGHRLQLPMAENELQPIVGHSTAITAQDADPNPRFADDDKASAEKVQPLLVTILSWLRGLRSRWLPWLSRRRHL
jgi:hypothetical protein